MTNLKEYYNIEIKKQLKKLFGYKNNFQIPKVTKVSVNIGSGTAKDSADQLKTLISELSMISGQKPRTNKSRKSISGFKLREGQIVGLNVSLRNQRMYDFLLRLVSVALPRIRDFRGLSENSFDKDGNFSIGIKEHTIFPEIKYDSARESFGMQINITIKAKNISEAKKLLELFGFPFSKNIIREKTLLQPKSEIVKNNEDFEKVVSVKNNDILPKAKE